MEIIVIIILAFSLLFMWLRFKKMKNNWESCRTALAEIQNKMIIQSNKIVEASVLNTRELAELMVENLSTVTATSNIWSVDIPYGKWTGFKEKEDSVSVDLRAFWYNSPGKIIGVKMPKGSKYEKHYHPWKEILVGLSGVVWIEMTLEDGTIIKKKLGPEDVIVIPPNMHHAVLEAKNDAMLLCIWGKPEK